MARIIIIDDDPLFAKLAQGCLAEKGHTVQWHEGAFGALKAVRNGGYEVILVDIQMPWIDGDKLVGMLRSRGVGTARIILMSSIAEHELRSRAQQYGADAYFPKGHSLDGLAALVDLKLHNLSGHRALRGGHEYPVRRSR